MTFTADQLDLQPPGSALDWYLYDDGFIAGDYRIHLMEPGRWQVMCDGVAIDEYHSLKTAFVTCERHAGHQRRRTTVMRYGTVAALAVVAWFLVDAATRVTGIGYFALALVPVVFVGFAALVRCVAAASGDPSNPYAPQRRFASRP
jgi:hypothetical protein